MGNRYNQHMHHQNLNQRTTFLPMLCSKPSIKDVHLRRRNPSSAVEPSSPKIGCMGQVKTNNRVIGYPATTKNTATTTTTASTKHNKPKRLFPGENLTTIAVARAAATTSRGEMIGDRSRSAPKTRYRDSENYAPVNVAELDPPLPVVKPIQQPAADGNLWKRRSGGCELKTLQLQQIYLPNKHSVQPIIAV